MALSGVLLEVRSLYRAAGLHTVAMARRAALPEAEAAALKEILERNEQRNHADRQTRARA